MQHPVVLMLRALRFWLTGRLRLTRRLADEALDDRGERFRAFRKVVLQAGRTQPPVPGAVFQVRFRFKSLSARANRWLSLIPIPLIVAQPGFRSKTWLLGQKSGEFIGRYEFDTVEQANAYWDSLPLRLMRRRAAPGTLAKEVTATAG